MSISSSNCLEPVTAEKDKIPELWNTSMELLEKMVAFWDAIPQEWKDKISPVTVGAAGVVGNAVNCYKLFNRLYPLQLLMEYIQEGPTHSYKTCCEVWAQCEIPDGDKSSFLQLTVIKDAQSIENVCPAIQDKETLMKLAKEYQQKTAESAIKWGSFFSALLIGVECYALWSVWSGLKNAQNVNKASREKIPGLAKKLDKIMDDVETLKKFINKMSEEPNPTLDRKINSLCRTISKELQIARHEICELKWDINNQAVSIMSQKEQLKLRGVSNAINFVGATVQFVSVAGVVSAPILALQGAVAAAFLGLSVGNVYAHVCSAKLLEELGATVELIHVTDDVLKKIWTMFEETEKAFLDLFSDSDSD